jgi:hypothetical protein
MRLRAPPITPAAANKPRDRKYRESDQSALMAIAQSPVNVEMFTIRLYMTSLFSIHGMHQINSKGPLPQARIEPVFETPAGARPDRSLPVQLKREDRASLHRTGCQNRRRCGPGLPTAHQHEPMNQYQSAPAVPLIDRPWQ